MSLIIAGGWVMVPLLLISIIVLALIIDRSLSYIWNPLPDADQQKNILEKIQKGEFAAAETYFSETPWLKNYASALGSSEKMPFYEGVLAENISSLAAMMDKRLPLLATVGRISPLLGLFGTIIGMIQTFAVIAQSRSGIDMELLAEGIWQALITTATGLIIAIPAVFCYRIFLSIESNRLDYLNRVANKAVLYKQSQNNAA